MTSNEEIPPLMEIAEEHSALRTVVHWIEADLERQMEAPEGLQPDGPLLGPLRSLREHLGTHFEFEERTGVLPAAIMLLPDAAARLEEWTDEHRGLLSRLDALVRALEEAARARKAPASTFARELRKFFALLRAHDAFEDKILGCGRTEAFRTSQKKFESNDTESGTILRDSPP